MANKQVLIDMDEYNALVYAQQELQSTKDASKTPEEYIAISFNSNYVCDVIVKTKSEAIEEMCRKYNGAINYATGLMTILEGLPESVLSKYNIVKKIAHLHKEQE